MTLLLQQLCHWLRKHSCAAFVKDVSARSCNSCCLPDMLLLPVPCTQVCPYFLSRDMANTADLIFMPYNYIVDQQVRRHPTQRLQPGTAAHPVLTFVAVQVLYACLLVPCP